jgi:hypothetical protein
MLTVRQVARAAFRLAAAVEPGSTTGGERPRKLLDPRHLVRAGLLTARFGSELFDSVWRGPEVATGYAELDNKVRAFHFFESEAAHLESQPGILTPAEGLRSAQARLGQEQAVWAAEGIGHAVFERCRKDGRPTQGLLAGPDGGLARGNWTVLHTGMGMALAEAWLDRISGTPPPARLAELLADHIRSSEGAARPGYAELAFEPLGLVTRLLRPELVPALGAALDGIGKPWSELFWHGVGRGLYFVPGNLPPGRSAPWAGLRMAREEPPHEAARQNAVAGFSWAVTLVNLRQPAVVETFLGHHGGTLDPADPVAQGICSALLLWRETTEGSRELRGFVGHVAEPHRRLAWQRAVRGPFEEAERNWASPAVREDPRRLPELFRYR